MEDPVVREDVPGNPQSVRTDFAHGDQAVALAAEERPGRIFAGQHHHVPERRHQTAVVRGLAIKLSRGLCTGACSEAATV